MEVYSEIEAGKNKNFHTDLSKVKWIKIEKIKDEKSLSYFLDLDKGEAETIILSAETQADLTILYQKDIQISPICLVLK